MYIKNIFTLQDTNYTNATIKDTMYHIVDGISNDLYIYDNNKNKNNTKSLSSNYKLIAYNSIDNYYIMNNNNSIKFDKINSDLESIGTFNIKTNNKRIINDIAFDKYSNQYLAIDNLIAFAISTDGKIIKSLIDPYDFYEKKYDCYCELIINPKGFKFTAIGADENYNYVTYTKNGSTFLAKLSKYENIVEKLYIGDNVEINSIVFNDKLYLLGTDNGINKLYEISNSISGALDPKVQEIINKILDLLNNVSVNEKAIANMIDVESKKIQKIIDISDNFEEILAINNSAKEIVTLATTMETSQHNNLIIILESILQLEKYLNE